MIYDVDGWKVKDKLPGTRRYYYTIYHECTNELFIRDRVGYGFRYVSKGTVYCPFCQDKIPEELIFLLEMIKK